MLWRLDVRRRREAETCGGDVRRRRLTSLVSVGLARGARIVGFCEIMRRRRVRNQRPA
jgi:hypothetical protein